MIFGSDALHECVIKTTDTNTVYVVKLAADRLVQAS